MTREQVLCSLLFISWHCKRKKRKAKKKKRKKKLISHPCLLGAHVIVVFFEEFSAWGLRFLMSMRGTWRLRQCSIGSDHHAGWRKTYFVVIDCMSYVSSEVALKFLVAGEFVQNLQYTWFSSKIVLHYKSKIIFLARVHMCLFILMSLQVILPTDLFSQFFSNCSRLCHLFKGLLVNVCNLIISWGVFMFLAGAEVAVLCITKSREVVNYQAFTNSKGIYTVAETMPESDRWESCLARPISSYHEHCTRRGDAHSGIKFTYNLSSGHSHTVKPFLYKPASLPTYCSWDLCRKSRNILWTYNPKSCMLIERGKKAP